MRDLPKETKKVGLFRNFLGINHRPKLSAGGGRSAGCPTQCHELFKKSHHCLWLSLACSHNRLGGPSQMLVALGCPTWCIADCPIGGPFEFPDAFVPASALGGQGVRRLGNRRSSRLGGRRYVFGATVASGRRTDLPTMKMPRKILEKPFSVYSARFTKPVLHRHTRPP